MEPISKNELVAIVTDIHNEIIFISGEAIKVFKNNAWTKSN